jgi:hypothetical protein
LISGVGCVARWSADRFGNIAPPRPSQHHVDLLPLRDDGASAERKREERGVGAVKNMQPGRLDGGSLSMVVANGPMARLSLADR